MGTIKDEFVKEMKEYSGSSFMTIQELVEWSGRSDSYIRNLVWPLEWVQAAETTRLFFIPDVAEAIEERLTPDDEASPGSKRFFMRPANRAAYQDDVIGKKAREQGVQPKYSEEFKQEAVSLASRIGVGAAARELDVKSDTLRGWVYTAERHKEEHLRQLEEIGKLEDQLRKAKARTEL